MKQSIKNGIPPLIAVLELLTVEIINLRKIVPSEQSTNFEAVSNFVMLSVALGSFFLLGLPSISNGRHRLSTTFSNVAVSAMAFPMNIVVFEHPIYLEHFLEDLWGWHAGWLLSALVQVLVLSGMGSILLRQVQTLFKGITYIGKGLGNLFSDVLSAIRDTNISTLIFLFIGFLIWIIYLGTLCYNNGGNTTFSDLNFWWNSVLLWMYYFIVIFILHILISASQKAKDTILHINGKTLLVIVLIIGLTILANLLPNMLQNLTMTLCIPVTAVGLLWLFIKKIHHIISSSNARNDDTEDNAPNSNAHQRNGSEKERINLKYVLVLLISYVGIPLTAIFLATVFCSESSDIILLDPENIASWKKFFIEASETANNLLKQFM